jgi:hypothetical protein
MRVSSRFAASGQHRALIACKSTGHPNMSCNTLWCSACWISDHLTGRLHDALADAWRKNNWLKTNRQERTGPFHLAPSPEPSKAARPSFRLSTASPTQMPGYACATVHTRDKTQPGPTHQLRAELHHGPLLVLSVEERCAPGLQHHADCPQETLPACTTRCGCHTVREAALPWSLTEHGSLTASSRSRTNFHGHWL